MSSSCVDGKELHVDPYRRTHVDPELPPTELENGSTSRSGKGKSGHSVPVLKVAPPAEKRDEIADSASKAEPSENLSTRFRAARIAVAGARHFLRHEEVWNASRNL